MQIFGFVPDLDKISASVIFLYHDFDAQFHKDRDVWVGLIIVASFHSSVEIYQFLIKDMSYTSNQLYKRLHDNTN